MKNYKLYFSTLLIAVCSLVVSCSSEQKEEPISTVSLKFDNPAYDASRNLDSIIIVDVVIESTSPLQIISDEVVVIGGLDGDGSFVEGVVLADNPMGREVERAGYIFNNATQCWVWGRWITNTETGQVDFQFGSISEQAVHNICAPRGSYYAKS